MTTHMNYFDAAVGNMDEVAWLQSNDYSWGEVKVWTDGRQFFWARDAGCSCYGFGEYLTADDLKILDSVDSPAFRDAVECAGDMTELEKQEFVFKVRDAMTKAKR